MFDYETLRLIWWLLLGVLLIGFILTDGFDLGVGTLLPIVGQNDLERRIAINTVGPVWEGNQVWLILGGGAIFAAWPAIYALSFSGFYLAMFLVLFGLILRPVAFKYRSKLENPRWRQSWDWALFVGSALPSLLFGVAVGNVVMGVPFHLNDDLIPVYEGNLFGLLNPFALVCGLLSLTMIAAHGAAWLAFKADESVAKRARSYLIYLLPLTTALFLAGSLFVWIGLVPGVEVTSAVDWSGPSNPLYKTVEVTADALTRNFTNNPWLFIVPALGLLAPILSLVTLGLNNATLTFGLSKLTIIGIIATVGLGLFPTIIPSSTNPAHSLMVFDASSSQNTLRNMLVSTIIFLPLILLYTGWVYKVLWGRVRAEDVTDPANHSY